MRTEREIRADLEVFARHERFDPLAKRLVGDIEPLLDRLAAVEKLRSSYRAYQETARDTVRVSTLLRELAAALGAAVTPTPQDEGYCDACSHALRHHTRGWCSGCGVVCPVTSTPTPQETQHTPHPNCDCPVSTPEAATERCEHGKTKEHPLSPYTPSPWCPGPTPADQGEKP